MRFTLILTLLCLQNLVYAQESEVQLKADITFLGAVIGPTKLNGKPWDASYDTKKSIGAGLSTLLSSAVPHKKIIDTVLAGAPKGSGAPDIIGSIQQVGPSYPGLEEAAKAPIALADKKTITKNGYTPIFTTEYKAWPMYSNTRFRIRLWDKDMMQNDFIGTVEVTTEDIQKAITAGQAIYINVSNQSQNQILYIQISAIQSGAKNQPQIIGSLWN